MHPTDRYTFYETAVQDPEAEIEFVRKAFREAHGFEASSFREDFCGTFLNCCQWVQLGKDHHAIGVDLDAAPLQYGKGVHLSRLNPDEQSRILLRHDDVLNITDPKVEIVSSSNFSVCFMKKRKELLRYLQNAYAGLKDKGIFVADLLGGMETGEPNRERRRLSIKRRKFTYIWEQTSFNPITHEGLFHIHFQEPRGQKTKNAFSYDWRLWSIPEFKDVLEDAGFERTYVYWEGDDQKGGGNGVYERAESAENCAVWITYVVGVKG